MTRKLRSVADLPFVCTACGQRFSQRGRAQPGTMGLEDHWDARPDCRKALSKPLGSYGAPPFSS